VVLALWQQEQQQPTAFCSRCGGSESVLVDKMINNHTAVWKEDDKHADKDYCQRIGPL